jgi:hypothetical protein
MMQREYTFSLFYWLLANWNWATVAVLAVISGVLLKVAD